MKFKHLKIFEMKTDTLLNQELPARLTSFGYYPLVKAPTYLYAPGELPVCLVAHVDIVHTRPNDSACIVYDRKKGVICSPMDGCGADDRAGVAAILEILSRGYRPHVIFLDGEERGCIGATDAARDLPAPVDIRFMVEMDRMGITDAVYYNLDNAKFEKYVSQFGFKTAIGTGSDIKKLAPAWGVAAVNLSIGYFDAHAKTEYLWVPVWENTVEKVIQMLNNIPAKMYHYYEKKTVPVVSYYRGPVIITPGTVHTPVNNFNRFDGDELDDWNGWYTKRQVPSATIAPAATTVVTPTVQDKVIETVTIGTQLTEASDDLKKIAADQQQIIDEILAKEKAQQVEVEGDEDMDGEVPVLILTGGFDTFRAQTEIEEVSEEDGSYDLCSRISAEDLSFEFGGPVKKWQRWIERNFDQLREVTEDNINDLLYRLVVEDSNWVQEHILSSNTEDDDEEYEEGIAHG